jgi:CHAT domain-containing protein/tetratricopeptide (TPR) repeat protein
LLALLISVFQSTAAAAPRVLCLGEEVSSHLVRASVGPVYELDAPADLELSLALGSDDFDPLLLLFRADGTTLDVEGGGLLDDAWTRCSLRAGERLRIEVLSSDGRAGDCLLRASGDLVPPALRPGAARASAARARAIAERARAGGEHARAAAWFRRAGRALERVGPLPDARDCFRGMADSARSARDPTAVLEARAHVASLDLLLGDELAGLEELGRLEVETRDEELGAVRLLVLENLGRARFVDGDAEAAGRLRAEELSIARKLGSKPSECRALCQLARLRAESGAPDEAEPMLAAARKSAAASDEPELLAEVECQLAILSNIGGRSRDALDHLARALDLPIGDPLRAEILAALGDTLVALQSPLEARRRYEDSWRLSRKLGLPSLSAEHLLSFANLEMWMGEPDLAIDLLESALPAWSSERREAQRAEGLLSLVQARLLRDLASDRKSAKPEVDQILEIARRHEDLRLQVDGTILACCLPGRETPADDVSRRSLEELLPQISAAGDPALRARAVAMIAWDDSLRGSHADAEKGAQAALETFEALEEHEQSLQALGTIARSASLAGDADALEHALERAVLLLGREALHARDPLELAGLHSHFAEFEGFTHDLVDLRVSAPGLSDADRLRWKERGFAEAGSWKARSLVETLIRRRSHPAPAEASPVRDARAEHSRAREKLEELVGSQAPRQAVEPAYVAVREAHRRLEDLERSDWTQAASSNPGLEPRGLTSDAIRATLPDDRTALVEYVAGSRVLHAYVLTRRVFEVVAIGERKPIETDAARFVRVVAGEEAGGYDALIELGRSLHARLMQPVLARLDPGVQNLVIVPTVELSALPFEALIGPSAAAAAAPPSPADLPYLVRRYSIDCVPSAPVLAELSAARTPAAAPSILVFADPDYGSAAPADDVARAEAGSGGEPGRIDPSPSGLDRLEQTRGEAAAIAGLVASWAKPPRGDDAIAILEIERGARDHYRSAGGFELFLGPSATCKEFEERSREFSILHVAAHALRRGGERGDPALVLSAEPGRAGDLSCERILGLDLKADLVVLAACDTAGGRKIDGDGVRSLARAFLHAGANSVVASLWRIRDLEGRELMKSFYTHYLRDGLSPRDALRQAKLEFLRGGPARGVPHGQSAPGRLVELSDPFFWASCVYCGPPR